MRIEKDYFYKSAAWTRRRKQELVLAGGVCTQCGGKTRLIVHHVTPVPWENGAVEVESIADLLDVPLEVLCVFCHNNRERAKGGADIAYNFIEQEERYEIDNISPF